MEIVLISVPYTGTNFTAKLFTDRGFQRLGMLDNPQWKNAVYVAHCLKDSQVLPALDLAKTRPVVLPLRHPFRCEESTRRMEADVEQMIIGYENLINRFSHLKSYVLPVDSPDRQTWFNLMAIGLRLPLETDWPVVSSKTGVHAMDFGDLNPSQEVIDLVGRHKSFFSLYYP